MVQISRFCGLFLLLLIPALSGQGRTDYANYETPQVKAITVARVSGHDYLLVCNTPDSSVEIYDTDESLPAQSRLLARVRVGLEPCSILWSPQHQRFYTTDFLSDSVTAVGLSAPTGPQSLSATLVLSRNVGDEPMHLGMTPDGAILVVSFKSSSAVGAFDPITLLPLPPSPPQLPAPTERIELVDTSTSPARAIKEPRTVAVAGGTLFVLGTKGGKENTPYDFDVYIRDLATGGVSAIEGLGTTGFNMALAGNGDLVVVSGEAHIELQGGSAVAAAPTGFLESRLHVIQAPGTPAQAVHTRDLNLVIDQTTGAAVPASFQEALALPSDVVVWDRQVSISPTGPGTAAPSTPQATTLVRKIFLASMGTDRVAIVTPTPLQNPLLWPINRLDIPTATGAPGIVAGPRCLALKKDNPGQPGDPGVRVYCLNRIDNSVTIIDPIQEQVIETFALSTDPTPDYIRQGRRFLYSAKLSASGFVSCASCHTDGRTDALAWNLGDPTGLFVPFPVGFIDGPMATTIADLIFLRSNGFPTNKGLMVTQSLQGLLNWDVPPAARKYFTNGPYHWRGDRFRFTKFNEAFVSLFGLPNIGTPDEPMGIPQDQMELFEEFVNSILYPPNPQQPLDRVYTGTLGDPNLNDGSGAMRGLKLFHTIGLPTTGDRSCVQCHALPEGSNNRFTEAVAGGGTGRQPIESAALRGLFQRERRLDKDGDDLSSVVTGLFGLTHTGDRNSINEFIEFFFSQAFTAQERLDLRRFMHEFDWGTGPIVGQVETATNANASSAALTARLDLFEGQAAQANCGLAVRGNLGSTDVGWWFDPLTGLYHSEPGGITVSRATLLGGVTGPRDRLVFICTPLGSERRVAAPSGSSTPLVGPAPTQVTLLPMHPNTAYENVPLLTRNWVRGTGPDDFNWTFPNGLPTPLFPKSIRLLQAGLLADAGGVFGPNALRHDAPRRFRVAGAGIRQGAHLRILTPFDPSAPVPNPSGPPNQMQTLEIDLPLHPTGEVHQGLPVWETVVELEPLAYYVMLCGGPYAPGVPQALNDITDAIPEPPPVGFFDPLTYNWHFVEVENPGGQVATLGWVQLTID